jgi:hypothetical protein
MGRMMTVQIMRQLTREWTLPDEMKISWNADNQQEVADAERRFLEYLTDGWIAFNDAPQGRIQIFRFDPKLDLIVLMPPLGGG